MQTYQSLGVMADTASNLPAALRERFHAIDWAAWRALPAALARPDANVFRIWVAARELTPLTLQALRD